MIKNRMVYLITIFSTLLFILIYLLTRSENVLFFANLFLCGIICYKAKFSIFSLKSILINYVLISVFFQYNTGESYGILQLGLIELHYMEMMLLSLVYNFIMYMFIEISNIVKFEKQKITMKSFVSLLSSYACSIIAIISTIIAFPSIPFLQEYNDRFQALLPGNAWNHLTIISLILAYPKLNKSLFVKFAYLFCFVWFLLHGERVDMLGLAVFILFVSVAKKIYSKNKAKNQSKLKIYFKCALIIIPLVFGLVFIGEIRGGSKDLNIGKLARKILIQNTAADIGYVYNSSIHYVENEGYLYGKTYLNYIVETIPLLNGKNEAAMILNKKYYTPGGILILSEPYMNFGIIGLIIFEIIELYIIYWLIKSKKEYTYFVYLFLIVTSFRTSWYGLKYIQTGMIYIMPILYLMIKFIDKKVTKRVSRSERNIDISSSSSL